MQRIKELFDDIRAAATAAAYKWRERRWLRAGGNPDYLPF